LTWVDPPPELVAVAVAVVGVDCALTCAVVVPPMLALPLAVPVPETNTDVVTLEVEVPAVLVAPAVCASASNDLLFRKPAWLHVDPVFLDEIPGLRSSKLTPLTAVIIKQSIPDFDPHQEWGLFRTNGFENPTHMQNQ